MKRTNKNKRNNGINAVEKTDTTLNGSLIIYQFGIILSRLFHLQAYPAFKRLSKGARRKTC